MAILEAGELAAEKKIGSLAHHTRRARRVS